MCCSPAGPLSGNYQEARPQPNANSEAGSTQAGLAVTWPTASQTLPELNVQKSAFGYTSLAGSLEVYTMVVWGADDLGVYKCAERQPHDEDVHVCSIHF
jgi:hypothetical protein